MFVVTNAAAYQHPLPPPIDPTRFADQIGSAFRVWDITNEETARDWRVTEIGDGGVTVTAASKLDGSYLALYPNGQFTASWSRDEGVPMAEAMRVGQYVLTDVM